MNTLKKKNNQYLIYTVCTCSVFGTIVLSMSWYDLWLVSEYSSHQSSKQSVTSPSVIIMMTTQILATNSIYCMTRQFPERDVALRNKVLFVGLSVPTSPPILPYQGLKLLFFICVISNVLGLFGDSWFTCLWAPQNGLADISMCSGYNREAVAWTSKTVPAVSTCSLVAFHKHNEDSPRIFKQAVSSVSRHPQPLHHLSSNWLGGYK